MDLTGAWTVTNTGVTDPTVIFLAVNTFTSDGGWVGSAQGGRGLLPERIPPEESGSDLLRGNGPGTIALSARVESPQSVVQGCPAQGTAVGPGEEEP
jgi:hypothetical protein